MSRVWRKRPLVPHEFKRKMNLYSFTFRINRKMKILNSWTSEKAQAETCANKGLYNRKSLMYKYKKGVDDQE